MRMKKLLLHKSEIRKLDSVVQKQGYTLIPLELYFKDGRVKMSLGICRGKQLHDKRDSIAKRDSEREIQRALRNRQKT
jgi:SsrA-binding protein